MDEGQGQGAGQEVSPAGVGDRCHAPNVFGTVDMEKVSR